MINPLNGRLDLTTCIPVLDQTNQWSISAAFSDSTGVFNASSVQVGNIIYNDASILGLGALRYKIISIDPSTSGSTLVCTIIWDMKESQPFGFSENDYPIVGTQSIVGYADNIGTTAITSMSANLVDEAFISAVRNVESARASLYLSTTNPSIETGNAVALQPLLPIPDSANEVLVSGEGAALSWSGTIDPGTF